MKCVNASALCRCGSRYGWVRPVQVKKALTQQTPPTTNSPPTTNPSHEGAMVSAANMSVWNAAVIYRNTLGDSKHCRARGGSHTRKVLLNLSHLA